MFQCTKTALGAASASLVGPLAYVAAQACSTAGAGVEAAHLATLERAGLLLDMLSAGEGAAATKIMTEMAMSQEGRAELLRLHQLVSDLLPYASSMQAANVMKSLQDVSGALARGGF